MEPSLDAWFVREILVHEAALMRYLRRHWRQRDEIHDLRQEIYARIYEAATGQRPRLPKSFLFATARHMITDRLRRNRVVSIEAIGDLDALNVLVDELTPDRRLDARQMLQRLARAFDRLPKRCREVVWLRRVEELSQKDIAKRLGISEKTVENQIAKGSRFLADYFYGDVTHGIRKRPRTGREQATCHDQQQTD